jgi:hypothetical protein
MSSKTPKWLMIPLSWDEIQILPRWVMDQVSGAQDALEMGFWNGTRETALVADVILHAQWQTTLPCEATGDEAAS